VAEYYLPSSPESILAEAARVTSQDRERDYGHPLPNHQRIAALWSAILGVQVTPEQVVLCMIGTKIARLTVTPDHRDSVVDIAGYARAYQRIRHL
jgi:hypothetical protein